jgi:tetratricopeptide (TPR) repeat protein
MSQINWMEILGWQENEIHDLRYVAYSYIKEGIYEVALKLFDALAVLTPPNAYDLQTVGALHLQMGDGLKALDFLDRSLKLEPHHLPTLLNRAKALFMLGYKKQGLTQAMDLQKHKDKDVAEQALSLILSYQ